MGLQPLLRKERGWLVRLAAVCWYAPLLAQGNIGTVLLYVTYKALMYTIYTLVTILFVSFRSNCVHYNTCTLSVYVYMLFPFISGSQ